MSDLDISGTVTITGAGEAAKDLNAAAGAATKLATETKKVDAASKSAADKIGAVGSAAGALGSAVGMVNPQLGSMISGMGNVAGAATSMAGAARAAGLTMSTAFGPVGVAVAAVTALAAAGAIAWMDYKDKQKAAADSIRATIIPALDDIISRLEREKSLRETKARLTRGEGTALEQESFKIEAEEYLKLVIARRDAVRDAAKEARELLGTAEEEAMRRRTGHVTASFDAARRTIENEAALVTEISRANSALEYREELLGRVSERESMPTTTTVPTPVTPTGGGGRPRGGGSRRVDAAEDENRRLREVEEERLRDAAETYQRELELLEEYMNNEAEVRDRIRNQEIDESNAAKDHAAEVARDIREAEEDAADLQNASVKKTLDEQNRMIKEAAEERRDIITEVEGAITGAVEMAGEAIVESAKNAGDSEREIAKKQAAATVFSSSVKAAIETAESIAAFASYNIPGGIAHGMAAAAFISAAVMAGGQKLPPAESPETGGGGGGTRSPGGGPRRSDTGDREMAPIVVNIGSSGLVYAADRVQLGRDIDSMVSEARGRGGRGM